MSKLYLVMASFGEYSDRCEWPVALYETETEARKVAEGAAKIASANRVARAIWRREVGPGPTLGKPAPIVQPNIYDPGDLDDDEDSIAGDGDQYWVVAVELRKLDAE